MKLYILHSTKNICEIKNIFLYINISKTNAFVRANGAIDYFSLFAVTKLYLANIFGLVYLKFCYAIMFHRFWLNRCAVKKF